MSLPVLNTTVVGQLDLNKQVASIRSYINQLRDELETEIDHITYENLDPSLRKKIDSIQESVFDVRKKSDIMAENISANYMTAREIGATFITAAEVDATYVKTTVLEANYVTTTTLQTNYLTTTELVSNYINANYISALGITVAAANITGKLTADQIDGTTFTGFTMDIYDIDATKGTIGSVLMGKGNVNCTTLQASTSIETAKIKIGSRYAKWGAVMGMDGTATTALIMES